MKVFIYTVFALVAFAANSVLCRMALGDKYIDAASFTIIRLLSGVAVLAIILFLPSSDTRPRSAKGSWFSASLLFVYAAAFSFAYITLDTATGALILFAAVQITMILMSIFSGKKLHVSAWLGIIIAFSGVVYLLLPELTSPSFIGFLLMSAAGVAWGIYSLCGANSDDPLYDTALNFVLTIPFVAVLALIAIPKAQLSIEGVILAILSGSLASGIGYTFWYMVLPGLSATVAAVVQLSVPVIAAVGGVIFVSEPISLRMMIATALVLGGILAVLLGNQFFVKSGKEMEHHN